mgnify:CR=1 FL=1
MISRITPNIVKNRSIGVAPRIDLLKILSFLAVLGFVVGLYLAIIDAPTDLIQGHVQRIFYLHLGAFAGAFIGFVSAVIGGIAYLKTRKFRWDMLAHAGVEVGFVLAMVNIVTGVIYARPIVNSWWTWDPKLTAVTIMTLTYAAYLMLRNGIDNRDRRRVFAAVYGILAFTTVINTFMVIRIRPDTLHDAMFVPGGDFSSFPMGMQIALYANLLIWSVLITSVLMGWRIRLEKEIMKNEQLRLTFLEKET